MPIWIIADLIIVLVLVVVVLLTKKGTMYFPFFGGFTSLTTAEDPVHHLNSEQLHMAVQKMLTGT